MAYKRGTARPSLFPSLFGGLCRVAILVLAIRKRIDGSGLPKYKREEMRDAIQAEKAMCLS